FGTVSLAFRLRRDKHLGGQIKFGEVLKLGTGITAVMGLLNGIWTVLLNRINPERIDQILSEVVIMWEKSGVPEEQMDSLLQTFEAMIQPFSLVMLSIICYAIGGLIVSAIMGISVTKRSV
ncbi:MAG: DUF4199 domain-containing protein, partial [Bacteroidota bacterium]